MCSYGASSAELTIHALLITCIIVISDVLSPAHILYLATLMVENVSPKAVKKVTSYSLDFLISEICIATIGLDNADS